MAISLLLVLCYLPKILICEQSTIIIIITTVLQLVVKYSTVLTIGSTEDTEIIYDCDPVVEVLCVTVS